MSESRRLRAAPVYFIFIALAASLLAAVGTVNALPSFSASSHTGGLFASTYAGWWAAHPTSTACRACHGAVIAVPTAGSNPYGALYLPLVNVAGTNFTAVASEAADSDGDGVTNGVELLGVSGDGIYTYPGNATDKRPPTSTAPAASQSVAGATVSVATSTILTSTLYESPDAAVDPASLTASHGTVAIVSGNVVFTPEVAYSGAASFSYRVKDGSTYGGQSGNLATVSFTVTGVAPPPFFVTTLTVSNPVLGVAYSTTIAVSGGVSPYTFAITAGTLPPGLLLNTSTGVISGTATTGGSYSFTVRATDNLGTTASHNYTVVINVGASGITLANPVTTLAMGANDAGRVRVADIQVADDGLGTNALTLTGTDAASFEIISGQLFLRAGVALDIRVKPALHVTVNSDDASIPGGPEASAAFTLNVSLPLGQGLIEEGTENARLKTTARTLDAVCETLAATSGRSGDQNVLLHACGNLTLDATDGDDIDVALKAIAPEEAFATTDLAFSMARGLSGQLFDHMASSGAGDQTVSISGLRFGPSSNSFASLAASLAPSMLETAINTALEEAGVNGGKVGVFVSLYGQDGSQEDGAASGAVDFSGYGATLGLDYRPSATMRAGLALTWTDQEGEFQSSLSRVDSTGFAGSVFGSIHSDGFSVDGQVSIARRQYDLARQISFVSAGDAFDETATASPNGTDLTLGVRLRKPVFTGDIELVLGATAIVTRVDGYEETGASGFNLFVNEQSERLVIAEIGLRGHHDLGAVQLRYDALYGLQSGRGRRRIGAGFLADPLADDTIVLVSDQDDDKDMFTVGAGLTAPLGPRMVIDAGYRAVLGLDNAEAQDFTLSLRRKF